MKKARLLYVVLSLIVIISIALSGCASQTPAAQNTTGNQNQAAGDSSKPVKLVVASFYPVDKVSGWDGLVKAFTAKHPNVTVEVQVTPGDQYQAKLLSQIAGGDAPDIAGVENTPFPQYVEKNMLTPLDSYLAKSQGFATKDFFPHLLDRYTYDGKVFGIPYDAQPAGLLFFNPKLFDDAGVAYPTNEWTWNDLRDAAKKLTKTAADGTVSQWGLALGYGAGGPENTFIYAFGGKYVDDLRNPTKSMLDDQKAIDGVQFMVDLIYKDKVMPTPASLETMGGSAVTDMFNSGKVAMTVNGFWIAVENPEAFQKNNVHMVLAPKGPDGTRMYPTGGTAYTILRTSKNADLAWEFITEFLGPTGYQEAFKSAKLGAIYPPAHIPSFDWYMAQKPAFVDTIQPNKDALNTIMFAPYPKTWPEIATKCINPETDLIKRNQKPVAETMKSISACVNDALKAAK